MMMPATTNENGTQKQIILPTYSHGSHFEKEHFIMTATPTAPIVTDYFEN
jgi:hypothetical protein